MPIEKNVVLDSNIFLSSVISPKGAPAKVVELVFRKVITNYTSEDILVEFEEVLERPYFRKITLESRKSLKEKVRSISVILEPDFDEHIAEDPDDNMFINCALAAKADIITGDNHLLKISAYKGIRILSPAEFLREYY